MRAVILLLALSLFAIALAEPAQAHEDACTGVDLGCFVECTAAHVTSRGPHACRFVAP